MFQAPQLVGQFARFDGNTQRRITQNRFGRGEQAIVEQAARRRVGAVLVVIGGEHGVNRADTQSIGAVLSGTTGKGFQHQGIAQAAIAFPT